MTSVEQPSALFRPTASLGGSLSPRAGHLPFAADLIPALQPSLIVELGVSFGDTYFGFCQLVTENQLTCSVYGVDTWTGKAKEKWFDAVSRHNSSHYQSFSTLLRKSLDDALSQFDNESISLLNLDGNQPYEVLKRALGAWLPKVRQGGIILISNIATRSTDASRLWNDLRARFPHFAFRHSGGLGVLNKTTKDSVKPGFLSELFGASMEDQERFRRYYATCAEQLEPGNTTASNSSADRGRSLFQVFRAQDSRYQTTPELSHMVTPGIWTNLQIALPNGIGKLPLRLDVVSKSAVVDVATLSLRKEDGHTVWSLNPKSPEEQLRIEGTAARMPESEFFRVLAIGDSPHVFLPALVGASFEEPLELEIRLRIDTELKAVQDIYDQWNGVQKLKQELESKATRGGTPAVASPVNEAAAVAKAKADSAKYLAQSRIEYEAKIRQITVETDAHLEALRAELEALRVEHEQTLAFHANHMAEERRAHQVTTLDKENLVTQQPRLLQEISIAQGNVEELKAEVERLSGELANAEFDLSELRKLNARLSTSLEEERTVRSTMQDSGSWQLTKPLRAVGDLFGPRKKY